jgi:hypothetical protein
LGATPDTSRGGLADVDAELEQFAMDAGRAQNGLARAAINIADVGVAKRL